jgi:hypothetical protein
MFLLLLLISCYHIPGSSVTVIGICPEAACSDCISITGEYRRDIYELVVILLTVTSLLAFDEADGSVIVAVPLKFTSTTVLLPAILDTVAVAVVTVVVV